MDATRHDAAKKLAGHRGIAQVRRSGEGWYVDTCLLPDPCDAGFYVRYVDLCRQAGIDPAPPERMRALTSKWNAMRRGEPVEPSESD